MDTTSNALSRILHQLSIYPDAQTKLRAELVGATNDGTIDLDYDTLMKLPYLDISKVPKRLRDCEAPRRARALASARNRGPTEYDRAGDLQSPHSGTVARGLSFALVGACKGGGLRAVRCSKKHAVVFS